ncbi:unnamed protein product [Urochloa humidicola]
MIDEVAEAAIEKTMSEAFFIEPAASLEGEGKPRPAANAKGVYCEPEPKVVEVKIEKVGEDYIEYLRKNPMRRPSHRVPRFFVRPPWIVESCRVTDASINKIVDLEEHILEQHDTKGYAMVLAEYLDNGRKRFFRLPEEQDTA